MARKLSNTIYNIAQRANYFLKKAWKSGISKETTKKLLEETHPDISLTKNGTVSTKQKDEKTFIEKFNGKIDQILDFGDKVSQKANDKIDNHFEKKREKRAKKEAEKAEESEFNKEQRRAKSKFDARIKGLIEEGASKQEIEDYITKVEGVSLKNGHIVWQELTEDQIKSLDYVIPTPKQYKEFVREKQLRGFEMIAAEWKKKKSFEEALTAYYDVIDKIDETLDNDIKSDLTDQMKDAGRDNHFGNYIKGQGDEILATIEKWEQKVEARKKAEQEAEQQPNEYIGDGLEVQYL